MIAGRFLLFFFLFISFYVENFRIHSPVFLTSELKMMGTQPVTQPVSWFFRPGIEQAVQPIHWVFFHYSNSSTCSTTFPSNYKLLRLLFTVQSSAKIKFNHMNKFSLTRTSTYHRASSPRIHSSYGNNCRRKKSPYPAIYELANKAQFKNHAYNVILHLTSHYIP